jgi:CheY-like chemotaxis protein
MKKDGIVLIAEHDEEHFDMIKDSLLRAGVSNRILRLADGRQTLDYLFKISGQPASEHASQQYVLFIDVDLPDVGGVEVLEKIKADGQLSKIPVIVLTTVDDPHTRQKPGQSEHLLRPGQRDRDRSGTPGEDIRDILSARTGKETGRRYRPGYSQTDN